MSFSLCKQLLVFNVKVQLTGKVHTVCTIVHVTLYSNYMPVQYSSHSIRKELTV